MTVFDAYAVLALLKGEPSAEVVERIIRADETAALTAIGVAEVVDHLVRVVGADEDEAALDLATLGLAPPLPVGPDVALRAGLLQARHYHRRARAISLADAIAAEVARRHARPLATSEPHLLDTGHAEGIPHLALADSSATTWRPPG
jgi:predicted nucleic acid-binding protein